MNILIFLFLLVSILLISLHSFGFIVSTPLSVFNIHSSIQLSLSVGSTEFLCLIMLSFCGAISLYFSCHYFGWQPNNLNLLIILFICVMASLILTNDFISSLVMWEYLGFVSFILILYYSTLDTTYAANVTLVSSRFGDMGLFLVVGYGLSSLVESGFSLVSLSLFLVIVTKSAILPFSSWLLEAMRAPTPVSCLVHSSTLVAAGVWFICQYGMMFSVSTNNSIVCLSIVTVIASAFSSLFFTDTKKIVALSTCNNVSWCIIYYLCGFDFLCVAQLLSHGVAKCMLFIGVGDVLAGSYSSQNFNVILPLHLNSTTNWLAVTTLILLISGVPFNGVFFTKHLLLSECSYNINMVFILSLYFCVMLSYLYSFRLLFLISRQYSGVGNNIKNVMLILSYCFIVTNVFNYILSSILEEHSSLSSGFSYLVLCSQLIGCVGGFYLSYYFWESGWFSQFLGQDSVVKILYMWTSYLVINVSYMVHYRPEVELFNILEVYLNKASTTSLSFGGTTLIISLLFLIIFLGM